MRVFTKTIAVYKVKKAPKYLGMSMILILPVDIKEVR